MNYKQLIESVITGSQMNELPSEFLHEKFHIWNGDINHEKDWDDFIGGQLVNHMYYEKSFDAAVDLTNLAFGASTSSFYSLFSKNTTIEIYTKDYHDITGKFITLGSDLETKYLAISYELRNFTLLDDKEENAYLGKIILVDVIKFLSSQVDDGDQAPSINIEIGKVGEEVDIPVYKAQEQIKGEYYDPDIKEWHTEKRTNKKVRTIEVLIPTTAVYIGAEIMENTTGSPESDRIVKPTKATTKPKHFPINPFYCILLAQWQIPSMDNYGFTHPSDYSNQIKTLMASQTLGSTANSASDVVKAGQTAPASKLMSIAGSVFHSSVGLAQKMFGDKGTLANSLAVVPTRPSSEGSAIKLFIQGDGATAGGTLDENGYLNLAKLEQQQDYIEVNQANGEFAKVGKSMSPSNNEGFNKTTIYRALGLSSLEINEPTIPALATPFADGKYAGLKIDDNKIDAFLRWGVPRRKIKDPSGMPGNMLLPEDWDIYVRNMFFRPDPYSFFNWPVLIPAELGTYQVEKTTSIAYDYSVVDNIKDAVGTMFNGLEYGLENSKSTSNTRKNSHWNKTITSSQLTNNDLYDPNKTFLSFRFEFDEDKLDNLYQFQLMAFTASIVEIKLLDENDEVIRHHKFNSQGMNIGTSATIGSVFQF